MQSIRLQLKKLGEMKMGMLILGIGLILGIIASRIFKGYYWNQINLLDTNYLNRIKTANIDYPVLLRYVFWNNYRTFILFWIFTATAMGLPYISFSIIFAGFKCGFFLSVVMMRYNIKGILLIFGYTFPHYLLYIPLAFLCLRYGYWLCRNMYYENKISKKGRAERIAKHMVIIILLAIVLMLGGLVETYIGSFILKKILMLF